MQYPLILISSGRIQGNLSIERRQSELYSACLSQLRAGSALHAGSTARSLAARFDGLVLAGGGDLHPSRYGQTMDREDLLLDPIRDAEEEALFHAFYARAKPILGICRGVQLINVFLGGTLHQHLDAHSNCCHPVTLSPPLAQILPGCTTVNSYHHQAVDQIAPVLTAAAYAPDNTVEALVHPSAPILGVQWHPERMVPSVCEDVQGQNHLALFSWLLDRC